MERCWHTAGRATAAAQMVGGSFRRCGRRRCDAEQRKQTAWATATGLQMHMQKAGRSFVTSSTIASHRPPPASAH